MKTSLTRKLFLGFLTVFALCANGNAQLLKKLGKKAEKAAEQTIERRVEKETTEKTDQVLDSILEPETKGTKQPEVENTPSERPDAPPTPDDENTDTTESSSAQTLSIYSKFDFVPGEKVLFFDNFSNDFIGDFPSQWNTNGSGEVVEIGEAANRWFKILPGSNTVYIPDVTNLPEEFTLEFDVIPNGLDNSTSSQAFLRISVTDDNTFNRTTNFAMVEYSFCQFIAQNIVIENRVNGKREIRNGITADIRNIINRQHHVSIAINKQRFRMWINEQKYADVPRLVPVNVGFQGIKLNLRGIDINKENVFLTNFKVAEGGLDLRRTLIANGKVSTNGILFDVGSANIQPQSMGIIRQISQVLQQEKNMNLNIVGHTDADGSEESNMTLSQKRAEAVKNTLISVYGVSPGRLSAEGKGESEPIGDNTTADGKAQNRRVEFIKA